MVKILKGILALILILLMTGMAYVHFNQAGLSRKILALLRSNLTTELRVKAFGVDVLTAFPHVAVEMHGVSLAGEGGSQLLEAEKLRLTLSLFSAFSGDVLFRSLLVENGQIHAERLGDGRMSFDVIQSNGKGNGTGPQLQFRKVLLKDMTLSYNDASLDQDYELWFGRGNIAGSVRNKTLRLKLDCEGNYKHVRLGRDVYLNNAPGSMKGDLTFQFDDQLYLIDRLELEIANQSVSVSGSIREDESSKYLDLEINQDKGELSSLLAILPATYKSEFPFNQVSGSCSAKGFIRGRMNGKENPQVHFDFRMRDANVKSQNAIGMLHNLDIDGTFDNGAFHRLSSASVEFNHIKGNARGEKFDAVLKLDELTDPVITCDFNGSLPAEFVLDYLGVKDLEKAEGILHFSDVSFGPIRLSHTNLTDINDITVKCTTEKVFVKTAARDYRLHSGSLFLDRDTLQVSAFDIEAGESRIAFDGWLTGLGDALQSGDPAYISYVMKADAPRLNLNTWIPKSDLSDVRRGNPRVVPVSGKIAVPLRLPHGELDLSVVEFRYEDMLFEALKADVQTEMHLITFDGAAHGVGGKLKLSGTMNTDQGYVLDLRLAGDQVKLKECFTQCHDFGQQFLQSKHLNGRCDVRMIAKIPWDLEGNLNSKDVHVLAGMSMQDGELIGFDMLEQFSQYCHAEDLRRIRFSRIDNFIEVKNGNVFIPAMFVRSNAANLVVTGIHTLDNHIIYNLKVNAGQVLAAKMKRHDPSLTPLPARLEGTFNLYFTIAGTTDAFTYGMDRRGVESSFMQSEEMRTRIREALRDAFGETMDCIEPPEWETIPEYDLEVEGEDIYLNWN